MGLSVFFMVSQVVPSVKARAKKLKEPVSFTSVIFAKTSKAESIKATDAGRAPLRSPETRRLERKRSRDESAA